MTARTGADAASAPDNPNLKDSRARRCSNGHRAFTRHATSKPRKRGCDECYYIVRNDICVIDNGENILYFDSMCSTWRFTGTGDTVPEELNPILDSRLEEDLAWHTEVRRGKNPTATIFRGAGIEFKYLISNNKILLSHVEANSQPDIREGASELHRKGSRVMSIPERRVWENPKQTEAASIYKDTRTTTDSRYRKQSAVFEHDNSNWRPAETTAEQPGPQIHHEDKPPRGERVVYRDDTRNKKRQPERLPKDTKGQEMSSRTNAGSPKWSLYLATTSGAQNSRDAGTTLSYEYNRYDNTSRIDVVKSQSEQGKHGPLQDREKSPRSRDGTSRFEPQTRSHRGERPSHTTGRLMSPEKPPAFEEAPPVEVEKRKPDRKSGRSKTNATGTKLEKEERSGGSLKDAPNVWEDVGRRPKEEEGSRAQSDAPERKRRSERKNGAALDAPDKANDDIGHRSKQRKTGASIDAPEKPGNEARWMHQQRSTPLLYEPHQPLLQVKHLADDVRRKMYEKEETPRVRNDARGMLGKTGDKTSSGNGSVCLQDARMGERPSGLVGGRGDDGVRRSGQQESDNRKGLSVASRGRTTSASNVDLREGGDHHLRKKGVSEGGEAQRVPPEVNQTNHLPTPDSRACSTADEHPNPGRKSSAARYTPSLVNDDHESRSAGSNAYRAGARVYEQPAKVVSTSAKHKVSPEKKKKKKKKEHSDLPGPSERVPVNGARYGTNDGPIQPIEPRYRGSNNGGSRRSNVVEEFVDSTTRERHVPRDRHVESRAGKSATRSENARGVRGPNARSYRAREQPGGLPKQSRHMRPMVQRHNMTLNRDSSQTAETRYNSYVSDWSDDDPGDNKSPDEDGKDNHSGYRPDVSRDNSKELFVESPKPDEEGERMACIRQYIFCPPEMPEDEPQGQLQASETGVNDPGEEYQGENDGHHVNWQEWDYPPSDHNPWMEVWDDSDVDRWVHDNPCSDNNCNEVVVEYLWEDEIELSEQDNPEVEYESHDHDSMDYNSED